MSDIPNPIAAFEIFSFKKEGKFSTLRSNSIKKLSKKLAKKLFGKKFATKARAQLAAEVTPTVSPSVKSKRPAFKIEWANSSSEIKEAQRLRYKVFAEEMGANLAQNAEGLDVDEFDAY
jgi:hypothetical protein